MRDVPALGAGTQDRGDRGGRERTGNKGTGKGTRSERKRRVILKLALTMFETKGHLTEAMQNAQIGSSPQGAVKSLVHSTHSRYL